VFYKLTKNKLYISNKNRIKIISRIFLYLLIGSLANNNVKAQIKNPRNVEYHWNTDTTKRNINLDQITVHFPRHTFPRIDYPKFIGKVKGLKEYFMYEPVIAIAINGRAKAYPLNVLTMHEIANDTLGGVPILATYCPLCNSSVVYERRLKNRGKQYQLDFELSGMLRNSGLIMADKQTETWWQQLTGLGLVGELANIELDVIPSMIISVKDFFIRYPDGKILSPETGTNSQKKYGTNPYENYDDITGVPYEKYFDHSKLDSRLPPMERLIDIKGNKGYKVYPFSIIAKEGIINDYYDGRNIVIFYKKGTVSVLNNKKIIKSKDIGSATVFSSEIDDNILTFEKINGKILDKETKSFWDITGHCIQGYYKGRELIPEKHSNHFAFAWLSFHPESEIYRK
jgi:hypothetical protein